MYRVTTIATSASRHAGGTRYIGSVDDRAGTTAATTAAASITGAAAGAARAAGKCAGDVRRDNSRIAAAATTTGDS
jgi:hypothetical protein